MIQLEPVGGPPRWSQGRGRGLVPSRWQATHGALGGLSGRVDRSQQDRVCEALARGLCRSETPCPHCWGIAREASALVLRAITAARVYEPRHQFDAALSALAGREHAYAGLTR